jgi:AraC-like DNA-binding protein
MDNSADPNLYFSTTGPFTVSAAQPVVSPLGQIIYAGTKWNSRATYAHAPPPDFMRPTPHYLLVYTLEGEADYVDSTGLRGVLKKGSLVWAKPGVSQSYGPQPGSRWSEFFMWFSGPMFDTWQAQGFPGERSRMLTLEPLEYWSNRFCHLVQPSPAAPKESPLLRICHLQQMLAEALQIEEFSRHTSDMLAWRQEACSRLAEGTLTSPSLAKIAASMHVSYSAFRKRFLQLTGMTPSRYRSEEIIRHACRRLLETNDPVYRIAADLGFHDAFHFSRRFKIILGLSPRAFRQQGTSITKHR